MNLNYQSPIMPHPLIDGVYVDGNTLYTRSLVAGQELEDVVVSVKDNDGSVVEYREWNPYKSNLAAAVCSGAQNIWIKPGSRVLVVTFPKGNDIATISHISDVVGPQGMVYVVDTRNLDTLANLAQKRFNIVPIIHGGTPSDYGILINMVDVLFASLDNQPQFELLYVNARYFLEAGGHYVLCVEARLGDAPFAFFGTKEEQSQFKRLEHVSLDPFDRDHAYAIGGFRVDLDDPVNTFSTDLYWTQPNLHRVDGVPPSLYEKQKDLPTYMLFESSLGYALFEARHMYDVERNYKAIEKYISSYDKVFRLIAYHLFASADEALMYLDATSNETVPANLIEFLVHHLPEPMKDGECCYSLALPQSSMVQHIVLRTKIACSRNLFHDEILRGVRMHTDIFFDEMKRGDLERAQLDLARKYCSQRLGKSLKKRGRAQASSRENPLRRCNLQD